MKVYIFYTILGIGTIRICIFVFCIVALNDESEKRKRDCV